MRTRRDVDAPKPEGSSLTDVRYWRAYAAKYAADLQHMESRLASKSSTTYADRRQQHDDSADIFDGTEETAPFSSVIARPPPSRHLQVYLRYDTAREHMIQLLYNRHDEREMRLSSAVAAGLASSIPQPAEWFYPSATPSEGLQSSKIYEELVDSVLQTAQL
ncbi:hypothetical protein LTR35_017836 [Friedmanniomyces endolithicus]|nr:hypothetical protein LTR35_017836 [Friedmanniomyces endolithicus]KAK0267857.1 hypothetical protein LTS00_017712 [Friedmanniomyces endolithicus]